MHVQKMKPLTAFKLETSYDEQFEIEYEIVSLSSNSNDIIASDLRNIEERISANQERIDNLNIDIDRLTNYADEWDYIVAAASGLLTGMIDAFFVGEFNFDAMKADSHKHVNHFVEKYAKLTGYKDNGRGLKGAIEYLEEKFPVNQDNIWKGLFSSTKHHHLDDFAHHPTILGLIASIGVTFFKSAFFVDNKGKWHYASIDEIDTKQLLLNWCPLIISGILRWIVYMTESKYLEKYDKELPKPLHNLLLLISYSPAVVKILSHTSKWFGHLVSDMGGSKNTPGGGMGIPGLFVSTLKELSSLPILKDTRLPQYVGDLYAKGKWDMRSELAILEYAGKQSIPVILNELFVRTFYFVRHLIGEYRQNSDWKKVNWDNVIPWSNRTINRMLTIASGTFVAVDVADAAIRSATKSVDPTTFFANLALRLNFVGVGRFAIAIGTDVYMGYKCNKYRNERMHIQNEQLMLYNAKLYYKQAGMWIAAKDANDAIERLLETSKQAMACAQESISDINEGLKSMQSYVPQIEKHNPNLLDNISQILKYGK